MTVKQTADAMGCSEQTVRNLIQSGELPGVKLGKRFYVSRAAFEALIKGE